MRAGRGWAAALALIASPAWTADLSPRNWPNDERTRLEALEQGLYPIGPRTSTGSREVVSATMSPVAVHAGMEALRQGGTAADAAAAVALTQVATDLGAVVSYAGVAELTYYEARTGKTYVLDAGWGTYAEERDPASIPAPDLSLINGSAPQPAGGAHGRKTLVPGFMAGLEAAHRRFGKLPFRDLFAPAIWYAEEGVTVTPLLAAYFRLERGKLGRTPEGRRFLGQAGNALPQTGDRFRQPEVAALLREVSRRGARRMYEGPWAKRYVEIVRREGGAAQLSDLKRYRPVWETPAETRYGDATVAGPANPGGCAVLTSLNLLDGLGVRGMGPYWSDPKAFVAQARAVRLASVAGFIPQFASSTAAGPCGGRLGPGWAQATAPQLDQLLAKAGPYGGIASHSASVVVIDRWGNVAALVHSINQTMWGDTGIVVGGVPISGAGAVNRARLKDAAGGRHVGGDMAPVIAFRAGRPVAAVATIGSSLVPETVRMTTGLLDGRDGRRLAAAPALISPFLSATPGVETVPEGAYDAAWTAAVAAARMTLKPEPAERIAALRGTAAAASIAADGARRADEVRETPVFTAAR